MSGGEIIPLTVDNSLPSPVIEVLPTALAGEIDRAMSLVPAAVTVETAAQADEAAKALGQIEKVIEARRKVLTAPINDLKKAIDRVCAEVAGPIAAERKALNGKIGDHLRKLEEERQAIIREQERIRREAEDAARREHEAALAKARAEQEDREAAAKAAEEDDDLFAPPPPKVEPVALPPAPKPVQAPTPPPPVASAAVIFRTVHRLEVYDQAAIPRAYLTINETKLRADLAVGIDVPGARLVAEQVPVARGR